MQGVDYARFRRRNLPHWEIAGATYFVTFRLAGSLPAQVVREWRREQEQLRQRPAGNPVQIAQRETERAARLAYEKFDAQLDRRQTGPRHLIDPRIAALVAEALKFYEGNRYLLFAYVIMPNRVHSVLRPLNKQASGTIWGLDEIMRSLKGYTGKKANEILRRDGEFWQREYYDHLIRDEEEWCWYIDYTHANPVRAQLCESPELWLWSSASSGGASL